MNPNCSVIIEVPAELNATAETSRSFFPCFSPLWGTLTYVSTALVLPAPSRVAASAVLRGTGASGRWPQVAKGLLVRVDCSSPAWPEAAAVPCHGGAEAMAVPCHGGVRAVLRPWWCRGHGGARAVLRPRRCRGWTSRSRGIGGRWRDREGGQVCASVCARGSSAKRGRTEAAAPGGRSSSADSS